MNRFKFSYQMPRPTRSRRGGFTLVEILVAVAIMSLLLSIIFVPLRLGFETYHIGKVNSDLQQEAHIAIQQIAADLRKSQFVYPNARIPGVTEAPSDTSGCSVAEYQPKAMGANSANKNDWNYRPYVIADRDFATGQDFGVCSAVTDVNDTNKSVKAWNNQARIDMLQLRRNSDGSTANTKVGQDFIVSYYFRRLDVNKNYDAIDNPIVLFRAQIPYRNQSGGNPSRNFTVPNNNTSDTSLNAQTDWTQYPASIGSSTVCTTPAVSTAVNRSFAWITHNYYGEANLEPLTKDAGTAPNIVPGAHTLVTPSDMGLFVPRADTLDASGNRVAEAFVPELSFTEEAVGGGKINRVTINMTLAKYDEAGAAAVNGQGKSLEVRVSQTVDLPNAGCSN